MTDHRALIRLARETLSVQLFDVWVLKHYQGYGRRAGSLVLGISEEAWRYRIGQADRKMEALKEEAA